MPSKLQFYSEFAERTARQITGQLSKLDGLSRYGGAALQVPLQRAAYDLCPAPERNGVCGV